MGIALQPARRSDKNVDQHYRDTILSPVAFDQHIDLLGTELADQLKAVFPDGTAPMWGITPGLDQKNVRRVEKLNPGDWIIFSGDKHLYFGGVIALLWRNAPLAERLWGTDDNGNTWEYMYALAETRGFDVPFEEVRDTLVWKPKRIVQNVTILKESEVELLEELLSLDPASAPKDPGDGDPANGSAGEVYSSELERSVLRTIRGEQATLKRRLLPGHAGQCALCGRTLPRALLVAAHIKKRAMCNDEEKRDLANIAMLACTLGCDAVYEQGYVTVAPGGDILVSPLAAEFHDVAAYIDGQLAGRVVTWWTETRSPYFHWHRTHSFKDSPPE